MRAISLTYIYVCMSSRGLEGWGGGAPQLSDLSVITVWEHKQTHTGSCQWSKRLTKQVKLLKEKE